MGCERMANCPKFLLIVTVMGNFTTFLLNYVFVSISGTWSGIGHGLVSKIESGTIIEMLGNLRAFTNNFFFRHFWCLGK